MCWRAIKQNSNKTKLLLHQPAGNVSFCYINQLEMSAFVTLTSRKSQLLWHQPAGKVSFCGISQQEKSAFVAFTSRKSKLFVASTSRKSQLLWHQPAGKVSFCGIKQQEKPPGKSNSSCTLYQPRVSTTPLVTSFRSMFYGYHHTMNCPQAHIFFFNIYSTLFNI